MRIRYEKNISSFNIIPGAPISYWASKNILNAFSEKPISEYAYSCKGLDTCDNDSFVRFWSEVQLTSVGFDSTDEHDTRSYKWFPYCKGGDYRRWYGNYEKVVLWENDGFVLRNLKDENGKMKSRPQNTRFYFKEGLTFNSISSSYRAMRYMNHAIFGGGGSGLFSDNPNLNLAILALINSNVSSALFKYINSGLNFLVGDLLRIPFPSNIFDNKRIGFLAGENINISKVEWDSFETSWDFKKHPLI